MIRVRYPRGSIIDRDRASLTGPYAVEVTDPGVIALEEEKNGPAQFAFVERGLRPWFERRWSAGPQPFTFVSVETQAGCNCTCSFCPVSRHADPRPAGRMTLEVLTKIAGELAEIDFAGGIALFGNNEPLLDDRIADIVRLFGASVPKAQLRMLTNGTLMTPDLVRRLFDAGLGLLTINNYTDGQRMIRPLRRLIEHGADLAPFDIRVSMRHRDEVLTTRGGLAPNKPVPAVSPRGFCALPFTEIHISYTGGVSLCGFDPHHRESMGDVTTDSLRDIWTGHALTSYRDRLIAGVRGGLCGACDFDGFRDPRAARPRPLDGWEDDDGS